MDDGKFIKNIWAPILKWRYENWQAKEVHMILGEIDISCVLNTQKRRLGEVVIYFFNDFFFFFVGR
jgi:hypothetical protein